MPSFYCAYCENTINRRCPETISITCSTGVTDYNYSYGVACGLQTAAISHAIFISAAA